MAHSKAFLQRYQEALLEKRKEAEKEVANIAASEPRSANYDEGADFAREHILWEGNKDRAFQSLKVVNLRREDVERGRFTGTCPQCKKDIPEAELLEFPLRNLCVECQRKQNGKGRKF